MNQEITAELVLQCQSGDMDAMEQLLFSAYTPVSYLCSKILQDESAAQEQTREILQIIFEKLNTLSDPEFFEKWMCRITAARCVQMLPQLRWGSDQTVPAESKTLDIAGEALDEAQTAEAVQQMVDNLPEDPRLCILLYCCSGMNSKTIGQVAGYSVDAVHNNLNRGQALIQEQLEAYMDQGTSFSGITSLASLLHTAMYQPREDENAIPLIYGILGKELPVPPDPGKWVVRILSVIAAMLLIVFLILCGILGMKLMDRLEPETVFPTTQPTAAPTEQPTQTTAEETTEGTIPETSETSVETTEATEATAATVPETTASAVTTATTGTTTSNTGNTSSQVPGDAPKTGTDGHAHRYLKTSTNFDCEKGGTKRYLCSDCDYYYTVELAPSGTHSYTLRPAGPPEGNPTCTSAGKAYKLCSNCNQGYMTDDPDKPALGHSYTQTVVSPTTTEQGYTLHTCSRCGTFYKDTYVDALATESTTASTETTAAPAESTTASGDAGTEI